MLNKKTGGKAALLTVILSISLLAGGCTTFDNFKAGVIEGGDAVVDVVRIGVFEPMTGAKSKEGKLEIRGIELAHELFPEALGKPVELVYADNKSDSTIAEGAARELVDKKVAVVLGSAENTLSLAGGDIFEKAQIPAIAITNTNPLVTGGNPYYFRVCFLDTFQGIVMAKYAAEDMYAKKAATLHNADNDYGGTLASVFTDKFVSLTGDENAVITGDLEYKTGDEDFSEQLTAIQASGAHVVFLPATSKEAAAVIKQARAMGIATTFLGVDSWGNGELTREGGAVVENAVYPTYFDSGTILTENTQVFLNAYREKYGEDAVPSSAEALGFDAYMVALNGITQAETAVNGARIQSCLSKMKQFPAVTGNITFDEDGNPIKSVVIKAVQNGVSVYRSTEEPLWN